MVSARKVIYDEPSGGGRATVLRTWADRGAGGGNEVARTSQVRCEETEFVGFQGQYWVNLTGFRPWSSLPEVPDLAARGLSGAEKPDGRGGELPAPAARSSPQKVKTAPLPPFMAHEFEKVWT